MAKNRIPPELVREALSYDPLTGKFTWKRSRQGVRAGSPAADHPKPSGYIYIQIDKEVCSAQIWAWVIMTGAYPVTDVDHENTIRSDNRWTNLRAATRSQNNANGRRPKNNTSGAKGVSWERRRNCWRAYIVQDNRQIHLGYFDDLPLAAAAYKSASKRIYGEFARAA